MHRKKHDSVSELVHAYDLQPVSLKIIKKLIKNDIREHMHLINK